MQIKLIDCKARFLAMGVDISKGAGVDAMNPKFKQAIASVEGWNYDFAEDTLWITVADGTKIPARMSDFGDVRP